jgi:aspartyl-tRNA(Asn)/glutamyl-tRNA(Gln) amidotransferase subunit A
MPLGYSLDTVGPLGETVEDCALVMAEISGYDWRDSSMLRLKVPDFYQRPPSNLQGVRIGVPKNFYFDHVSHEVTKSVLDAVRECERLGATRVDIQLPDIEELNTVARIVQWGESSAVFAGYHDPTQFGADVWSLIEQGWHVSAGEYVNAQRLRSLYRTQFDEVWSSVDLLVTPATPITAPPVDHDEVSIDGYMEDARLAATRLARAVNLLGEPALSLPCGKSVSGLPIGLQLISAPHTDAWLLRVGQRIEQAL